MTTSHEQFSDPTYRYGRAKSSVVTSQCRWDVHSDYNSHQCPRAARVDGLWCKQHSPQEDARKQLIQNSKYEQRSYRWEHDAFVKTTAINALRAIATGMVTDPVNYAIKVLVGEPKKPEGGEGT